jgi:hypothetical protein
MTGNEYRKGLFQEGMPSKEIFKIKRLGRE